MQTIIMTIRKMLLRAGCLLFCCYASLSYAVPSDWGYGYFEATYFSDFQWHIDQDGYAVIDRADLALDMYLGQNPCQDYFEKLNKVRPQGKFFSCEIQRELCSKGRGCKYKTLFESTNAKALTLSQLSSLLSTTGKVEFFGTGGGGGGMMFTMQVNTTTSSTMSFLPKRRGGGGVDGIPETPVELPTTCSASNVTIDHKTLGIADLQGNTATGSLTISCNKEASVQLKVTGYNHANGLDLTNDKSLISRLTLDGTAADKTKNISVPSWGTSVEIKSTLEKTGETVTPGSYSKTLVALMTVN